MSLLAWIVLGLISGFVASKIVNKTGEGFFLDIALGVIGAVIGGWLFGFFGRSGVTGLNPYSFFVAVVGAVALLVAYHAVRRGMPRPAWSRR
ncbi:MAG TPA: GlsB/YeaQ/YmgE family stress response membrane protein [Thermoanaerobaculia bacterium]|nr:GlsB/YeaQ/YmgE family stress response membrane protein [Thermoanaerobaculia bacterium]